MAVVVFFGALITSDPLLKFTNFLDKYLRTPTYNYFTVQCIQCDSLLTQLHASLVLSLS